MEREDFRCQGMKRWTQICHQGEETCDRRYRKVQTRSHGCGMLKQSKRRMQDKLGVGVSFEGMKRLWTVRERLRRRYGIPSFIVVQYNAIHTSG